MDLRRVAEKILKENLKFSASENFLVLFDNNKRLIAEALLLEARKISSEADWWEIPVGKVNGEEPKKDVADMMRNYDVIIIATTKSLSWTKARKEAVEYGARIASMPGITEDILLRTMEADYEKIRERTKKIIDFLKGKKEMRLITRLGTDLVLKINPKIYGEDSGIYDKEGKWGNLPAGEAFFAPFEVNGTVVIDASFAGIGKLDEPIKIEVENSRAVKFEGGPQAEELKFMVDKFGEKGKIIAELGIGTNDKAEITGKIIEDEKSFGTVHIALGRNSLFGGTNDVGIHVDGVITKPTIYVDDIFLMEDGELKI